LKIDSTDTIDNVYVKVKEFLDKLLQRTSNQADSSSHDEQEEPLDKKDFQNVVYVLGNYIFTYIILFFYYNIWFLPFFFFNNYWNINNNVILIIE